MSKMRYFNNEFPKDAL